MKIKTVHQIEDFLAAVKKCKGGVELRSIEGDVYNLKSTFSQFIAMSRLLEDAAEKLELFCENREDEKYFFEFFSENPEVL